MKSVLPRRMLAERLGSVFLAALVIGSGIAAQTALAQRPGLQLFENAAATAARPVRHHPDVRPVSGGHFNPVVSFVDAVFGGISWRDALAYLPVQVAAVCSGRSCQRDVRVARRQHFDPSSGESRHTSPRSSRRSD